MKYLFMRQKKTVNNQSDIAFLNSIHFQASAKWKLKPYKPIKNNKADKIPLGKTQYRNENIVFHNGYFALIFIRDVQACRSGRGTGGFLNIICPY